MRNNGIRIDFNQDLFEDDDIVIISRIGKVFNAKVELSTLQLKMKTAILQVSGSEAQDFRLFIIA